MPQAQLQPPIPHSEATARTPAQNATRSYSAAVQQPASNTAPVSAALTHAATREQQILFDPAPGEVLFTPDASPAEIATKIAQAFSTIQTDNSPNAQIKATIRLCNGGIIVEMSSVEVAKWIRISENRLKIIDALNLPASIKEQRFSIIVPFLPISSSIEDAEWRHSVEKENNLPVGVIESANWIKPRIRRAPEQWVAHAIFHFTDPNNC